MTTALDRVRSRVPGGSAAHRLSRGQRQAAAAVLAAVAAGVVGASPTDVAPLDVAWAAALAASLALIGSHARRVALMIAAIVMVAVADTHVALVAAGIALLAAVVSTRRISRKAPFARGVAGGAVAVALLAGAGPGHALALAAVWVAAIGIVVGSGLSMAPSGTRRRARNVATTAFALGAAALLAGAIGALSARRLVDRGTLALDRGLAAAHAGDVEGARRHLDVGRQALEDARGDLRLWGAGARALPGASQNLRALDDVLAGAVGVARQAATTAASVDQDELVMTAGTLDLGAVAALDAPLSTLAVDLAAVVAEIDETSGSPLLPPVRDRLDVLRSTAERAGDDARRGAAVARAVPGLLGGHGPRRYLTLFTSPAEARGRFGFPASYAVLTATDGRIELGERGSIGELVPPEGGFDQAAFALEDSALAPYVAFGATRAWRSVTVPPDFATVAMLAREMWTQTNRPPLDGVLRLDPSALAALVAFTGPLELPGLDRPLTSETMERYLVFDQYVEFGGAQVARREALEVAGELVFDRLVRATLPGPRTLATFIGPAVAAEHLQVHVFDDEASTALESLGMAGRFPAPAVDGLSVTNINSIGNKIDTFLRRRIRYEATVDGDGALDGFVEIELRNDAPASGLADYVIGSALEDAPSAGTNRTTVQVHAATRARSATLDGAPLPLRTVRSQGWWLHQVSVDVAPGSVAVLRLELDGLLSAPGQSGAYRLDVRPPIGDAADELSVEVRDERGAVLVSHAGPLGAAAVLRAPGAPPSLPAG